jgi:hypothetical protein
MTEDAFILNNPNHFCADSGGFNTTQVAPVSVRCPHCRQIGTFAAFGAQGIGFAKSGTQGQKRGVVHFDASIRMCPNSACKGIVFVVADSSGTIVEIEPPELLDFNPDNLPPPVLSTLTEAVACHAAGAYRAAAMMVRRLLEEICELNGIEGPNLHQRLEGLKQKIVLPQALFDAMHELKALGNDATHIKAKAYDNIGKEEASDSIELAKEILKALYQFQSLLARLQARKASS